MTVGERRILRDDSASLLAARSGDAEAFGELYRRYLGDVRAFCARRVGDPIRAEDLAQDTFVKAFEQIGTFRTGAAFWPWLSTIARNLCIDESRRRRRIVEEATEELPESADTAVVPPDPTPETAIDRDTRARIRVAVASAMAHLSPRERRLIIRSAVNGETWSEIARAEHGSLDAVRNTAWRARNVLRSLLADPLRDLRVWAFMCVREAIRRHERARGRRRTRFAADWMPASMIGEHVGGMAVALVVFSTALLPSAPAPSSSEVAIAPPPPTNPSATMTPRTREATPPPSARAGALRLHVSAPTRHASIGAGATRRPNAAGTSSAEAGLVIYGPGGQVLYWRETWVWCGDGRATRLLPEWSPVRAVC